MLRVGVIDGFDATWSQARQTYGEGTPTTGEKFDQSSTLHNLKSTMDGAAPGSRWSGGASEAYGAANTEHQRVIGAIGDLDKQLGTQVTNAANLVNSGRNDLDSVKKWVHDAAATTQNNQAGERMKMTIVSKGLGQLTEVINNTDGQMQKVKGEIDKIKGEYEALGTGQKFAKEGQGEGEPKDEEKSEEEKKEEELGKRAEEDVRKALEDGDDEAAARIDGVFESMTAEQNSGAKPLSPEQNAYLSQMQTQMKGMSVADLKSAEERLGDHGKIVGDSWQLMTNDDIDFSDAETGQVAPDDQKFGNLPQSVQDAIKSPGLLGDQQVQDIAAIIKDGSPTYQTGTELDREMMRKADRMMDAPLWEKSNGQEGPGRPQYDVVLQDVFESAGRDHQIVHDHLLGTHGDDGNDFLHDVNQHAWNDKGAAAGSLFSWTENAQGTSEETIAAATAEKYGTYIGENDAKLLDLPGDKTLGQVNPELVQAYAHGLGNYIPDIADLSTADQTDRFDAPDSGNADMPIAKGIFSVISSDAEASDWFNGKANAAGLAAQNEYAAAVKNGVPDIENYNKHLLDAANLRGLVEVGTSNAAFAEGLNGHDAEVRAYERQKSSYEFGVKAAGNVADFIPGAGDFVSAGIDHVGSAMQEAWLGPAPGSAPDAPIISNMGYAGAAQMTLNPLLAAGVPVDIPAEYRVPVDPNRPELGDKIGTVAEIREFNGVKVPENVWETTLSNTVGNIVGKDNNPVGQIAQGYEDLVKNPNP
ncbi:hypothetical protein MARA_46580 [Mycolicibacterium arabiense]|uniref:ESX-1 secretion-associated protein EspA/EspE-like domain-containing protein n=1 Tax=Mycolicibacterium arabiense TaxID=1286181 RepID=A0A7I7S418_9MYCO|nr:hypothetical protein MARA_46580 [Mycolicibacterium arabiense]